MTLKTIVTILINAFHINSNANFLSWTNKAAGGNDDANDGLLM